MPFTKISVLVPTRSRLARLQTLLASFWLTVQESPGAELVFRIDDDDPATAQYLAGRGHRIVVGPRRRGYASMPDFFNDLAAAATGDVLLCGNDDMVFQTRGWPARVLEVANRFPDGLFDLGVSTHNDTHYPFSIVSRAVTERLGFLWDPRIFWGDIFLRDVMAAFDRCVMLPSVVIDHDWAGDEASQNMIYQRDPTYWTGTHARAVADAVARLRSVAA
jgi:hypothetical protein